MAWSGFIGIGTITAGVFTESVADGYVRTAFSFANPVAGKAAGTGAQISYPVVSATAWSFNAYGFFTASSATPTILAYPLPATVTVNPGTSYSIPPASVVLDIDDSQTWQGQSLDPGGLGLIAGTLPTAVALKVPLTLPTYTVSTLPVASTALKGSVAYVTDATSPTWLGTLTGSGAVGCLVFCTGVVWLAG